MKQYYYCSSKIHVLGRKVHRRVSRFYFVLNKVIWLIFKVRLGSAATSTFVTFWTFFFLSPACYALLIGHEQCWTVINRRKKIIFFIVFSFQQNKLYPNVYLVFVWIHVCGSTFAFLSSFFFFFFFPVTCFDF